MVNALPGIDAADVYIDDAWAFSSSWEHHIDLLWTILWYLHDNEFTINPLKCKWVVQHMDWLGYLLTPCGLKPQKKEIDMILHMDHPCTSSHPCCLPVLHIFTVTCGQVASMFSIHLQIIQVRKKSITQLDWWNANCIWQHDMLNGSKCSLYLPWP